MRFLSWTIFDEENEIPTLEAEIAATPHLKKTLSKGHLTEHTLEIFSSGVNVLGPNRGFFIEEVTPTTNNTILLSGRGYEVLLKDESYGDVVHWHNGKPSDLVKLTLDSTDVVKTKYRSADITDSPKSQYREVEFDDVLELVQWAARLDEYKFIVERHGDDFRLIYGDLVRGGSKNPTRSFSIDGRTHFTESPETLVTVINEYKIKGKPENLVGVTVPDATYVHANATASQAKYGKITKRIVDSSLETNAVAGNLGLQLLNNTALPAKEYDFDTTRFVSDLYVGDYTQVVDEKSNINIIEEVKGIEKRYRVGEARSMFVDLVSVKDKVEKDLRDFRNDLKKRRNDLPFDPHLLPYYRDSRKVNASVLSSTTAPAAVGGFSSRILDERVEDTLPSDFSVSGTKVFWEYTPSSDDTEATAYAIMDTTISPSNEEFGDTSGSGAKNNNTLYATSITPTTTIKVAGISYNFNASAAGNIRYAIYDDTGGDYPNDMLASTSNLAAGTGWKYGQLDAITTLSSGTKYWIVWVSNVNNQDVYADTGGANVGYSVADGTGGTHMDDPYPGGGTGNTQIHNHDLRADILVSSTWAQTEGGRTQNYSDSINRSGNTIRYHDNAATTNPGDKYMRLITVAT